MYHGNGKTYYKNGNVNFDGIFFEGKSTGNGIKYYENGSILYKSANSYINDSVIFDKNDISKHKNVKIDILSSRGISQLIDICGRNIDFSDCPYDKKTFETL